MSNECLNCFDRELLCERCPEVQRLYAAADASAEYGVNWYEFINTEELWGVYGDWFDTLTEVELRALALMQLERTVRRMSEDEISLPILQRLAGRC